MSADENSGGPLLVVRDLVKDYPMPSGTLKVLDGVSLELAAGESVAVTGPSGSGKSTLLHVIGTLDRPTSGEVIFDGRNVHELGPDDAARFRNSEVGFVFQDHHLMPQLTALENVLLPVLAFARAGEGDRERASALLGAVGLAERAAHFPSQLSGGERQRVAIARAMVNLPRLLLCDEPTGNLDASAAEAVARLVVELRDEHGVAVIVATHNERLAEVFGRRLTLGRGPSA